MTQADPFQLALNHRRSGRIAEAEAIARQIIAAAPNDPRPLHLLGTILLQKREPQQAAEMLHRAAELAPHSPDAHFALGDALRLSGKPEAAEAAYRKSIALRPLFPPVHNALALALVQQNKLESAVLSWQRAVQLRPDYAEAHANLGAALAQQKKPTEAADSLRKAIALNPNFAPAHNNLANVLDELEERDAAIQHWSRAIELQPNYFDALVNLAKALQLRGEHDRALALLDRACAAQPHDPDARFLRGLALLLQGDLLGGFLEYRHRLRVRDLNLQARQFAQPEWDGETDVSGKTILLHAEQGLGDTIQFVRYAPLLVERGARVILECPAELVSLLRSVPGAAEVVARGAGLPPFDLHAPILELPRLFQTDLATIPENVPYLFADAERAAAWSNLLAADPPGRRIGLVWSGNPKHSNDRNRSIPLRAFEPLGNVPEVSLFSLQKGPAAGQLSDSTLTLRLTDHTARLSDFGETAALIANLDLILSVDTSVAHLAGAMGKPTWLLLAYVPDWRWLLHRNDSPWYPSVRLFRQSAPGQWDSVIAQVVTALTGASGAA